MRRLLRQLHSRLPDEHHVRFCLDDRGKTLAKDRMIFDTQPVNGLKMGHSMGPPPVTEFATLVSVYSGYLDQILEIYVSTSSRLLS
jgi:hypothetical protein